jgi:hypothetical protein
VAEAEGSQVPDQIGLALFKKKKNRKEKKRVVLTNNPCLCETQYFSGLWS